MTQTLTPDELGETLQAMFVTTLETECAVNDNFFDLGGDSFGMAELMNGIETAFGVRVPYGVLLRQPTVRNMTEFLTGRQAEPELPTCVISFSGSIKTGNPALFCVAGAGGGVHWFRDTARSAALNRMFYGLESQAVNPELRRNFSIPVIAAEFVRAMRQVQPKGPYLLAGYSLGGLIAFECATILLREGERVERLILIDSYAEVTGLRLPARAWFVLRGLLTMSKDERSAYLREKIIWIKRMAQVRVRARARSGAAVPLEEGTKHFELQKGAEYQKIGLRPCELRVDVIVARDGSRKFTSMSDHGWGQFALTGCRVHEVPGNHYSMLQQPNAQVLGKKLRELVEGED